MKQGLLHVLTLLGLWAGSLIVLGLLAKASWFLLTVGWGIL